MYRMEHIGRGLGSVFLVNLQTNSGFVLTCWRVIVKSLTFIFQTSQIIFFVVLNAANRGANWPKKKVTAVCRSTFSAPFHTAWYQTARSSVYFRNPPVLSGQAWYCRFLVGCGRVPQIMGPGSTYQFTPIQVGKRIVSPQIFSGYQSK